MNRKSIKHLISLVLVLTLVMSTMLGCVTQTTTVVTTKAATAAGTTAAGTTAAGTTAAGTTAAGTTSRRSQRSQSRISVAFDRRQRYDRTAAQ
jgi:hypothetical protein